jgi:hypothetical protein
VLRGRRSASGLAAASNSRVTHGVSAVPGVFAGSPKRRAPSAPEPSGVCSSPPCRGSWPESCRQDDLVRRGGPLSHQSGRSPCSRENVSVVAAGCQWPPLDPQNFHSSPADRLS